MATPPAQDEETLTVQRLQGIVDSFEQACQKSDAPTLSVDLEQFLPPTSDPNRLHALQHLIRRELEIRWKRNQGIRLEEYLKKFPEMGSMASINIQLIYDEYRVRCLFGDRPGLEQYRERFPIQFKAFEKLLSDRPVVAPEGTMTVVTPASVISAASTAPKEAQTLLPIGGGYRLIKRLGAGAYGEVWKAEAVTGGIEAAVKIITRTLDHEAAQRELQSLESIKQLRHPFLLQNRWFESLENRLYIVMELADGSLRERLHECEKGKGIPRDELLQYTRESAEALDFLHSKTLQHRDVKPENILLLEKHVKVADFGLAMVLNTEKTMMTAELGGTPPYMAPEVWDNKISPHSDQYSLAAMYVELRLNRRLFKAQSWSEWMRCHTLAKPELKGMPEAEQQVLFKALAKEPKQRYKTCMAFAQALEEVARTEKPASSPSVPVLPSDEEPSVQRLKFGLSRRWLAGAGLLLACLLPLAFLLMPNLRTGINSFAETGKQADKAPQISLPPTKGGWGLQADATLPDGFRALDKEVIKDSTGGEFYKRIRHKDTDTDFILIPRLKSELWPHVAGEEPTTFYIMKYKVTLGLFRTFANTKGLFQAGKWKEQPLTERCPIFDVTIDEACSFAEECFHGKVPSGIQWDKAAGRYRPPEVRGEGPYQGNWPSKNLDIIVGKPAARDTDRPTAEVSWSGCCDMAGNGFEWTTDLNPQARAPLLEKNRSILESYHVYLRGKAYDMGEPLQFRDLIDPKNHIPEAKYMESTAWISFRVVVEPNTASNVAAE